MLVGCIKPEAENMEADVLEISIPDSVLIAPPAVTNSSITVFVKFEKLDIQHFAPEFILSEGASIVPASGTPQDFTGPVVYTVTSQDGLWRKEYKVSLLQNTVSDIFTFENWALTPESNYNTPYEVVFGEQQNVWASGNSGSSLVTPERKPEAYPTQRTQDVQEGSYAAHLETKSTGELGQFVGMPIAAGNLFLGQLANTSSTPGSGYQPFDIAFSYKGVFNQDELEAYAYKLAIIFSSSKNGAIFEGAVGSKLIVDNVKIVTE
jgi:hypothetical protein